MCLDGDSMLEPDAVAKSVAYFRDERVVATASNVNILPGGGLLGLVQRYEYLISYHMKKAHNIFNVEYIIGGIGSMFRRETLDEVGLYDTNTMTEDIDLTMKIIARKGNRNQRVVYAYDALTYTEAVPSFGSLVLASAIAGNTAGCSPSSSTVGCSSRWSANTNLWSERVVCCPYALLQEVLSTLIEPVISHDSSSE